MASKEQKHQESGMPVKQRAPKPAIETQPQVNSASLVQRAALASPSLSANNVRQLQRSVGNQAVGQLMAQSAQRQPLQRKMSTDLDSGISDAKGRGQPLKTGLQRSVGKTMVQRCKGQEDRSVVSSFDNSIRLDRDTEPGKVGEGGALTVYLSGSGPISHREVCLEWYDGLAETGTHLAVHLATPGLAAPEGRLGRQLGSFFTRKDEDRMESEVQQFGPEWDPNRRAEKNGGSRTVRLTEEQKENKRQLLQREIGKKYPYDIMNFGVLGSKGMNCKDWAKMVAPEAII